MATKLLTSLLRALEYFLPDTLRPWGLLLANGIDAKILFCMVTRL